MTRSNEIDQYISELSSMVVHASLNYQIWWVLKSRDSRPKYICAINTFVLFFRTAIQAHFTAMVVALYKLYETRSDTINVKSLHQKIQESDRPSKHVLTLFEEIETRAKPTWIKISILRNEFIGHQSTEREVMAVFKKAKICPDDFKNLIELTKTFLIDLTKALKMDQPFFGFNSREDILAMLKYLKEHGVR